MTYNNYKNEVIKTVQDVSDTSCCNSKIKEIITDCYNDHRSLYFCIYKVLINNELNLLSYENNRYLRKIMNRALYYSKIVIKNRFSLFFLFAQIFNSENAIILHFHNEGNTLITIEFLKNNKLNKLVCDYCTT